MNNLHRELAPISDAAWASIEEETTRTLKRYLAGRRVVDVQGPGGAGLSAVGTGHLKTIAAPGHKSHTMTVRGKDACQFGANARRGTGYQRHTLGHCFDALKSIKECREITRDESIGPRWDASRLAGINNVRECMMGRVVACLLGRNAACDAIAQIKV